MNAVESVIENDGDVLAFEYILPSQECDKNKPYELMVTISCQSKSEKQEARCKNTTNKLTTMIDSIAEKLFPLPQIG